MTVITTSSRSSGTLVKKLRLSNLFSIVVIPVNTAEPDMASDTSDSMSAIRMRVSSLLQVFRLSLSMNTNQLEVT